MNICLIAFIQSFQYFKVRVSRSILTYISDSILSDNHHLRERQIRNLFTVNQRIVACFYVYTYIAIFVKTPKLLISNIYILENAKFYSRKIKLVYSILHWNLTNVDIIILYYISLHLV